VLDNNSLRIQPFGPHRERALFLHDGLWVTARVFAAKNHIHENTLRARLAHARESVRLIGACDLLRGPVRDDFATPLDWVLGTRRGLAGGKGTVRYTLRHPSGRWVTIPDVVKEHVWASPRMLRARVEAMLARGSGSWEELVQRRHDDDVLAGDPTPHGPVVADIPWERTPSYQGPVQPWVHLVTRGL